MITTDVVVVGAGPCGLFQVFELGLLGIKAEVVDSIRQPGGQCSELYPDKPIYDIPAIPVCTGEELTQALMKQIEPFGAGMHLGQEVRVVQRQEDDTFLVETSAGTQFSSRAVVIAGGVGSFQPRMIRIANAEDFRNKSLHYRVRDPAQFAGKKLLILGGGDSALDWALELVDIRRTPIVDVMPLAKLRRLYLLRVDKNIISDAEVVYYIGHIDDAVTGITCLDVVQEG